MLTGDLTIACAECRSSRSLPWRKIIHSPFKDDTLYQFGAGCSGMRIMIKLVRTGFLAAVIAMGAPLATTAPAQATSLYANPKYAAIMINPETHEVLSSRRADVPRYPASITKVMTLYLARSEAHQSALQSQLHIS